MPFGRRGPPKAPKKSVIGRVSHGRVNRKKPVAKRPAKKTTSAKVIVRQQNLGQQTESRQLVKPLFSDPRAKVVKAMMLPSFFENSISDRIDAPTSGLQTWGFATLANQATLAGISDNLQQNLGLSANPGVSRYLLESATTDIGFSNLSTAPCTLNIYTCSVKRDTWFPPISSADQMTFVNSAGVKYYWDGQPVSAIREGLNAAAGYTPGVNLALFNVASVPSQSRIFKDYFKVSKTQTIHLAQGGNHMFRMTRKYDRFVDGSVIKNQSLVGVAGITEFIVYSVVGSIGTDAVGNITTNLGHIGLMQTTKIRYSAALSNQSNLLESSALPATGSVSIVNPGSGGTGVAVYN